MRLITYQCAANALATGASRRRRRRRQLTAPVRLNTQYNRVVLTWKTKTANLKFFGRCNVVYRLLVDARARQWLRTATLSAVLKWLSLKKIKTLRTTKSVNARREHRTSYSVVNNDYCEPKSHRQTVTATLYQWLTAVVPILPRYDEEVDDSPYLPLSLT